MILIDTDLGSTTIAGAHLIPAVEISSDDGLLLASYMNSTKSPVVSMSAVRTTYDIKPSLTLDGFSSRGRSLYSPEILKTDTVAPEADILAAYTEASSPSYLAGDRRLVPYTIMSGKSMSCPHVADVVGLLRSLHPDWSPAAIRSDIMTTARNRDNTGRPIIDSNGNETTPLSIGAGHIRPNLA
ncbi:subtilisin-like protease SBT5.4 [Typha latifolia]|uniref:subtilisin-like protease SBT5.4 n=1 Tax=Typha latifolia TaxID=4733 RepID=UPI003C2EE014